ncbi:MAG: methylase [Bacteroidetes bacterium]|nr:methylase [Bacteroidota bacterium]
MPYDPRLKPIARMLRNNMTLAEVLLWNKLKNKQLCGFDFHRQKPIDEFVVDFFCPKLLLAIEIDGDSHAGKLERDSQRQRAIEKFGVRFLRFSDEEVKRNLGSVVDALAHWVETQGMSQIEAADEEQPKN